MKTSKRQATGDGLTPPPEIIFFGNGPLADATLATLAPHINLLFHARTAADLATVKQLKVAHPHAHGILASFGVLIKQDLLDLFEPEGILNLHPSLLPQYRGASPIESAILNGDHAFSVSIMKLAKAMDAGPIYYQTTLPATSDLPKSQIYQQLAQAGSQWLLEHLDHLPTPVPQDDRQATFTRKFTPDDSPLRPEQHTATELLNQIRAFQGFPKSKYTIFNHDCIIHQAHLAPDFAGATPDPSDPHLLTTKTQLALICQPDQGHETHLVIDQLQPAGKKTMDARSFLNGYKK